MRLVRQGLTESFLLFVLGGIAGFAVLFCARKFLLQLVPQSLPRLNDISIGWGLSAFAIVVSVAAGTIFGLAPVWLTSCIHLTATLRQGGRGSNGSRQLSRLRHTLVIGELAFSLVLVIAAGLLLRSFWDLFKVQLGFNPTRVMSIETSLPNPNDPKTDIYRTPSQEAVLLGEVLRRNRTIPGAEETGVRDRAANPLGDGQSDTSIVSLEYFHVLGMTLMRGRLFVEQELQATPLVAVINQAAARGYRLRKDGKGENPFGKRVRLLDHLGRARPEWTTIVGVIGDARRESLADAAIPQIYLNSKQNDGAWTISVCADRGSIGRRCSYAPSLCVTTQNKSRVQARHKVYKCGYTLARLRPVFGVNAHLQQQVEPLLEIPQSAPLSFCEAASGCAGPKLRHSNRVGIPIANLQCEGLAFLWGSNAHGYLAESGVAGCANAPILSTQDRSDLLQHGMQQSVHPFSQRIVCAKVHHVQELGGFFT